MSSSQNIKQFLRQTFGELAKAEKIGDYERCLKACSKILKYAPNDIVALQCKVVALVHLQQFEDALQALRKNSTLFKLCTFEKAYCEYRLNRTDEALKTLRDNSSSMEDFRCQELFAQLLYRNEDYEQSYGLYVDLLKNSEDDFDEERRANLAAVMSQLVISSPNSNLKYSPTLTTHEQYFNESCRLCSLGRFEEAKKYLIKAEEICRALLVEDESPEEEIEDETCCIKLQMAYCQQMLGQTDEASKIYADVAKNKSSDVCLMAVTSNNMVSLKKESNLFDARKKMKTCLAPQLQQKLNRVQREIICYNNLLVNLHSNQLETCRKGVDELKTKFGAFESALLCEAALLSRQKEVASAIDALELYIRERGVACSDDVCLTLIQLYLNEGKTDQAFTALNSFAVLKDSPGILSLLVALCLINEDRQAAANVLTSAVDRLEKSKHGDQFTSMLLEECASMYLNANDHKTAAKYLEDLRKAKSGDATILARLINAYLRFDAKKAEELCRSLPDLKQLTQDLDLDSLENAEFLLLGGKYGAKKAARTDLTPCINDTNLIAQKNKRKKKRKVRLPKKMDPNVPIDLERWLPKFERSTYKKRKDKRAKDRDVGRGTQGAVSGVSEFDISTKPESSVTPTSPKPTPNAAVPGPRQQRPVGQKPKKKKKAGGKW